MAYLILVILVYWDNLYFISFDILVAAPHFSNSDIHTILFTSNFSFLILSQQKYIKN